MNPTTAHDALIAELLGDVGRLHDSIKELPKALGPVCGAIVKSTRDAQSVIDAYGEAQEQRLKALAAQERISMREDMQSVLHEVVRRHDESNGRWGIWKMTLAVFVVAFLGALAGYWSARFADEGLLASARYGRALGVVWNDLDKKTQQRIQEAAHQ